MVKILMGCVAVLMMVTLARGATIGVNTVDPMHDGSLWDASAGPGYLFFDQTTLMGGLDTQDHESPAMVLQRWWPDGTSPSALNFDYQTVAGKTFSNIGICFSTMSWDCPGIAYKDGTGAYIPVAPVLSALGSVSNWTTYLATYDLPSVNADRIRVTVSGNSWYTPMLSSVSLTVVPEPATIGLLLLGGLLLRKRS